MNDQIRNNYIEDRKQYWGPEFADILEVKWSPEHDQIAAMGCYTMLYHIADNFNNGEDRTRILAICGVHP